MEIAFFSGNSEHSIPFYGEGIIVIMTDENGKWEKKREIDFRHFDFSADTGLNEIHRRMNNLINDLDNCHVFVSQRIKGIPFAILDSAGFSIWKLEGEPNDLFDHIRAALDKRKTDDSSSLDRIQHQTEIPQPGPTDAVGVYEINLMQILDENRSLNSREILIPFLQNKDFNKLFIYCEHIPRWLEKNHELFNVIPEEIPSENGITTLILHRYSSQKGRENIQYPSSCKGYSCFKG